MTMIRSVTSQPLFYSCPILFLFLLLRSTALLVASFLTFFKKAGDDGQSGDQAISDDRAFLIVPTNPMAEGLDSEAGSREGKRSDGVLRRQWEKPDKERYKKSVLGKRGSLRREPSDG